jgi:membrane-bound lytic murein transglycosylase D
MEHIVRHGETLSSIANRYGVTVTAIMHLNRLHTDLVHPGQRIFIPHPAQQFHTHIHTHTHTYQ